MSSDRAGNRPLKPTLAAAKPVRTPLAPRVAIRSGPTSTLTPSAPRPQVRSTGVSPRLRAVEDGAPKDSPGGGNITPRSAARKSRVESLQNSPSQDEVTPSGTWPRAVAGPYAANSERNGATGGGGGGISPLGISGIHARTKMSKALSAVGEPPARMGHPHPLLRSSTVATDPGFAARGDPLDSRFFHASDVSKQEPLPKKPESRKTPTFFYADGKEDTNPAAVQQDPRSPSPTQSTVSEKRSSGPYIRSEPNVPKIVPMLSPTLNSLAASSPFFTSTTSPSHLQVRSPSPSKENIHLSYRKGASQIFGTRPISRPTAASVVEAANEAPHDPRLRPSLSPAHRKSTSLSSIDSGTSWQSRRRSSTFIDPNATPSMVSQEAKTSISPRMSDLPVSLLAIDTSVETTSGPLPAPESALSPTKFGSSELAADARRERKVLDLEISNSSLLAINASLEREVRRQRAELKRYRRLSRAGHFSLASSEHSHRFSEGLDTLDEMDSDDHDDFGRPSGSTELNDGFSDSDDDDSLTSAGESGSADTQDKHRDRLAKDERRWRLDLQRHKELLVQSQGMNQSLKRCMYATEDMIRDGKRALQYQVRVSDVKLGGRILTGHEDEDAYTGEQIEVEDSFLEGSDGGLGSAQRLLDVWSGLGRSKPEESIYSGDRDSGVEVDRPLLDRADKISSHSALLLADPGQVSVTQAPLDDNWGATDVVASPAANDATA